MRKLWFLLVLFLISCTAQPQPFLIDGSPQLLNQERCDAYNNTLSKISCYDIVAKYNKNEQICDRIELYVGPEYVQTSQNCKAQLEQSLVFAKGIINENTTAQDLGYESFNTTGNFEDRISEIQGMLKTKQSCEVGRFCQLTPNKDETEFIAVCLCILP